MGGRDGIAIAGGCELPGACGDAEPFEKTALGNEVADLGARLPGGAGEALELDMGSEVGLSGGGQRAGPHAVRDGLERVAGHAPAAVVDNDRRTAVIRDAPGDFGHRRSGGGAMLDEVALGCVGKPVLEKRRMRPVGEAEDEAFAPGADHAFAPARPVAEKLADGQGVEELVGDEEERRLGEAVEAVVPHRRVRGEGAGLGLAQHGGKLHKVKPDRLGTGSASVTGVGAPVWVQWAASDSPRSSPNIWLISGAVVKSAPSGSRVT